MAAINDGGPAFPHSAAWSPTGKSVALPQNGMSLRDWFAGLALQAMATTAGFQGAPWDKLAGDAYAAADAMLRARGGS